uniref:Uncharacterized protein n=1 Tax=Tetranychus urticae TaxID=32264 RepID=T1JUB0_TETUR
MSTVSSFTERAIIGNGNITRFSPAAVYHLFYIVNNSIVINLLIIFFFSIFYIHGFKLSTFKVDRIGADKRKD